MSRCARTRCIARQPFSEGIQPSDRRLRRHPITTSLLWGCCATRQTEAKSSVRGLWPAERSHVCTVPIHSYVAMNTFSDGIASTPALSVFYYISLKLLLLVVENHSSFLVRYSALCRLMGLWPPGRTAVSINGKRRVSAGKIYTYSLLSY